MKDGKQIPDSHGTFKLRSASEADSTSYWSGGTGSEAGLVVLQLASTCMKTEDAHKYILIIRQVGHGFDVFDMGMLQNKHPDRISVQVCIYMYIHCTHMLLTCIYCIYTCIYIVHTCTGNEHTC